MNDQKNCTSNQSYPHFGSKYVNDDNLRILWKDLQQIKKKYADSLMDWDPKDYECFDFSINDSESMLCYEQGKYIEYIEWNGMDIHAIPELPRSRVTYRMLEIEQLRYYLYWRTCFRRGQLLNSSFLNIYIIELLAEFGGDSPAEILDQLERIYAHKNDFGLSHARYVLEFAELHHLKIKNETVVKYANRSANIVGQSKQLKLRTKAEIISGAYEKAFDEICSKSEWKIKISTFVKKTGTLPFISIFVSEMLPQFEMLFERNQISFWDYLLGKIRREKRKLDIYTDSVWNPCVIQEICAANGYHYGSEYFYTEETKDHVSSGPYEDRGKSIWERAFCYYADRHLSTYILQYAEMMFRRYFECADSEMPQKTIRVRSSKRYHDAPWNNMFVEDENRRYQRLYYDGSIDRVIESTFAKFVDEHSSELEEIKSQYLAPSILPKKSVKSFPIAEQLVICINSATDGQDQFDKILQILNASTPSSRKSISQKVRSWIWDFWILHENNVPYLTLVKSIVKNNWKLSEKKAIINRDYYAAFPYLLSIHDSMHGLIARSIKPEIIQDTILIVFRIIDYLFNLYDIDSADILLGLWDEYKWDIFNNCDEVSNNCQKNICKNLGGIEIYRYDPKTKKGTVERHAYSDESVMFISYVLKEIDNQFRTIVVRRTGKNIAPLKNDCTVQNLYQLDGYADVCMDIPKVIALVISSTMVTERTKELSANSYDILVRMNDDQRYLYKEKRQDMSKASLSKLTNQIVKEYYDL